MSTESGEMVAVLIGKHVDTREKLFWDSVSSGLANMLLLHQDRPACWHHLQHVQNSDQNIFTYLRMSENEYNDMLLACKLGRQMYKDKPIQHLKNNWEDLLKNNDLPSCYEIKK